MYFKKIGLNFESSKILSQIVASSNNLVILNLSNNNLGNNGVSILADSFRQSISLVSVDVSLNYIQSKGANYLFDSLVFNYSISHLNISNNNEIHKNHIGRKGCEGLKNLLINNQILSILDISDNLISEDGFNLLCQGLEHNLSLISLNLANNYLPYNCIQKLSLII